MFECFLLAFERFVFCFIHKYYVVVNDLGDFLSSLFFLFPRQIQARTKTKKRKLKDFWFFGQK